MSESSPPYTASESPLGAYEKTALLIVKPPETQASGVLSEARLRKLFGYLAGRAVTGPLC